MSCYEEKVYNFIHPGFLEDVVDGAYLLSMDNSREAWLAKSFERAPYSTLHVHHTVGYKARLFERSNLLANIFRSALKRGQNRILVLEENCFFDEWSIEDIESIRKFIHNRDVDIYNLGTLPSIGFPIDCNHVRVFCMICAHSVIYCSPKYMQEFVCAVDEKRLPISTDTFWNKACYKKYHYYRPICFQLFPYLSGVCDKRLTFSLIRHSGLHRHNYNFGRAFGLCLLGFELIALHRGLSFILEYFYCTDE